MGCFLACFGYSKKRKRRKPSNKISSGDQRHGSYQPLDSVVTPENPVLSEPEFSNKGKEEGSRLRIKKKVSFNLNVKSYEPIPNDETTSYFSGSNEEEECEKNQGETTNQSASLSLSKRDWIASKMGSYPSNYRYQNCRDSYEEEDNIELEEGDLDDEDEDEDEDDDDEDDYGGSDSGDDRKIIQEFSTQFCSSSMESQKRVTFTQLADDKANDLMNQPASWDQDLKKVERNRIVRDRSRYVHSVLNPVENLSQWKAVKARTTIPLKLQSKENLTLEQQQQIPTSFKSFVNSSPFNYKPDFSQSKPLVQGIAVDASLSNWLVSSGTGSITNTCTVPFAAVSSKKNMLERSSSIK